jgi:serine/threonine-protein kinase PpkA
MKLAALCAALSWGMAACSAPLLMEGKKTLYQRVLTTPSCVLKKDAGASTGKPVPAFTRYYVYAREGKALKVGPDTSDKISGYIDASCAVDWKVQTALVFTNPAGRDRSIVFEKKDDLQKIIESKDPAPAVDALNKSLDSSGKAQGVVAREPAEYTDISKNFYLLPVLQSEENMFDDGTYARELEIASVTKEGVEGAAGKAKADPSKIKTFKAALVFVIDSSISMQPYIDRTKQAIRTIYKKLESEHLQNSVQFGLVSFRSNTKAVPGLEYESKMFVNPGEANSASDFDEKLKSLSQAKVSSALFDEDAYAGINTALSKVSWQDYGGRYVVLVTDAGAIGGSDKLSSTGLDSKELRLEADRQGVAIYALHLLTASGSKAGDHGKAKSQYEDLTFNKTLQKPLYYPVQAGSVDSFGSMVDQLATSIAAQVKAASEGKEGAGSNTSAKSGGQMDDDTRLLGHAMMLAYLGKVNGTVPPDFFRGWISDRDLKDHNKISAEPVVLLTKSQLSDLKEITQRVLESANKGLLDADQMFSQLRSIAASMGRDPASLKQADSLKLGELGLFGEYLDDLPYKSRLQELDEQTWMSMGPDEQNRAIEDLEQKLTYYQKCNDDASKWIKLADDAQASESVYPVQLEALP